MDHYFPEKVEQLNPNLGFSQGSSNIENLEVKPEESKGAFKSLFDQIKSKRLEYGTPNIANVGLQTPIQDRLNVSPSPLIPKPSMSNLFEDTMNLFDVDNPIDTGIDTSSNLTNPEEINLEDP
jgi:hypothetical protein